MSDDEQSRKPRFEPPPWEQEAFERFRAEQEELRKAAELDAALRAVQEQAASPVGSDTASETAVVSEAAPSTETAAAVEAPEGQRETTQATVLSEAQMDSMLIQLKGEEPSVAPVNMTVVNVLIGIFEIAGVYIIVEAALLFGKTRATGASGMLGAVASLVMLLTGLGFMGGGFMLFRKHHT